MNGSNYYNTIVMIKCYILIPFLVLISSCSPKQISLTSAESERGDAVVSLIVPDNNYGELEDIHLYSWTQNGELNVNRVLIDFDLKQIPQKAKITKAYLNLYFNPTSAYNKIMGNRGHQGNDSIVIQRVISNWSEKDVTWKKQPQTTEINQVIIPKPVSPKADYINIDITKIIHDIINSNSGNYGIMIKFKDEVPYNVAFFASSNHPQKNIHPQLNIYYK